MSIALSYYLKTNFAYADLRLGRLLLSCAFAGSQQPIATASPLPHAARPHNHDDRALCYLPAGPAHSPSVMAAIY